MPYGRAGVFLSVYGVEATLHGLARIFEFAGRVAPTVIQGEEMSIQWLFDVIEDRKKNPSEKSYTTSLFNEGLPKIAQKVGEEGTEVVVAALAQEDQRLIEEVADLTYHTLVLLAARGLTPAHIIAELEKRHK